MTEALIISAFLGLIFIVIGIYWIYKKRTQSSEQFWSNAKSTTVWPLVFTIVATQVGSGTVIGIASSTASSGTGYGFIALLNTFIGFLFLAKFAPKIKKKSDEVGFNSIPSLFASYYGRTTQVLGVIAFILAYLCLLSGQLYGAATIFAGIFETNSNTPLIILSLAVIGFTAFAGLKGDILSDTVLFLVMIIVLFLIVTPFIFIEIDVAGLLSSIPNEIWSPVTFGGYSYLVMGLLLGPVLLFVLGEMWMRIVAANSTKTAQKAFLYSSFVFLPFYALPLFIGLIASQMDFTLQSNDFILVHFLQEILPTSLFALTMAGLIAVIISTTNTMQLVISESIYSDLLRQSGEGKKELRVSQLITLTSGMAALVLSFVIQDIVQLVLAAFFIVAILFPATIAPFTNWQMRPKAALLSIASGMIVNPNPASIPSSSRLYTGLYSGFCSLWRRYNYAKGRKKASSLIS